jgi:hypothetical protein
MKADDYEKQPAREQMPKMFCVICGMDSDKFKIELAKHEEFERYTSEIKQLTRDAYIQISRLAESIRLGDHEGRDKFHVAEALMEAKKPLNNLMDILFPR